MKNLLNMKFMRKAILSLTCTFALCLPLTGLAAVDLAQVTKLASNLKGIGLEYLGKGATSVVFYDPISKQVYKILFDKDELNLLVQITNDMARAYPLLIPKLVPMGDQIVRQTFVSGKSMYELSATSKVLAYAEIDRVMADMVKTLEQRWGTSLSDQWDFVGKGFILDRNPANYRFEEIIDASGKVSVKMTAFFDPVSISTYSGPSMTRFAWEPTGLLSVAAVPVSLVYNDSAEAKPLVDRSLAAGAPMGGTLLPVIAEMSFVAVAEAVIARGALATSYAFSNIPHYLWRIPPTPLLGPFAALWTGLMPGELAPAVRPPVGGFNIGELLKGDGAAWTLVERLLPNLERVTTLTRANVEAGMRGKDIKLIVNYVDSNAESFSLYPNLPTEFSDPRIEVNLSHPAFVPRNGHEKQPYFFEVTRSDLNDYKTLAVGGLIGLVISAINEGTGTSVSGIPGLSVAEFVQTLIKSDTGPGGLLSKAPPRAEDLSNRMNAIEALPTPPPKIIETGDEVSELWSQSLVLSNLGTQFSGLDGDSLGAALGSMPPITPAKASSIRDALLKSGKTPTQVTDSAGRKYYLIKLPLELGGFTLRVPIEG